MRLAGTDITFTYPGAESPVFNDFSFQLAEPGFHAVFGPSGVGKTSLARLITGHLAPKAGGIIREDIHAVLYCYNLERLPDWSSVGRHLKRVTPAASTERKEELVSVFGLKECMGSKFSSLSLGQRNRVNLLRYLLQDFQVLIMDESLANVDEKTRETILLKIKALYTEVIFIYISHNVVEVAKFCRQIVVVRGAEKAPQARKIRGMDHRIGQDFARERLEQVMLEIMNAA